MDAILPLIGVVLGALLSYLFSWLSARSSARREDARAEKADAQRRSAIGREHAAKALAIIRPARDESWRRNPDKMSYDIETDDLQLDVAEAAIELIPDPVLRPRLARVLNVVRYPWTLSNSSYSEGFPVETQREGLYLLQQALAAYLREEPTPAGPDRLAKLAKANEDAHNERNALEADMLELEKQRSARAKKAAIPTRRPRAKK